MIYVYLKNYPVFWGFFFTFSKKHTKQEQICTNLETFLQNFNIKLTFFKYIKKKKDIPILTISQKSITWHNLSWYRYRFVKTELWICTNLVHGYIYLYSFFLHLKTSFRLYRILKVVLKQNQTGLNNRLTDNGYYASPTPPLHVRFLDKNDKNCRCALCVWVILHNLAKRKKKPYPAATCYT